jgi:hypothetical protein
MSRLSQVLSGNKCPNCGVRGLHMQSTCIRNLRHRVGVLQSRLRQVAERSSEAELSGYWNSETSDEQYGKMRYDCQPVRREAA